MIQTLQRVGYKLFIPLCVFLSLLIIGCDQISANFGTMSEEAYYESKGYPQEIIVEKNSYYWSYWSSGFRLSNQTVYPQAIKASCIPSSLDSMFKSGIIFEVLDDPSVFSILQDGTLILLKAGTARVRIRWYRPEDPVNVKLKYYNYGESDTYYDFSITVRP